MPKAFRPWLSSVPVICIIVSCITACAVGGPSAGAALTPGAPPVSAGEQSGAGSRSRWQVLAGAPGPGEFGDASGLATDRDGNVYVADAQMGRVHKLAPSGQVLTMWGKRGSAAGEFGSGTGFFTDEGGTPGQLGIALEASGTVLVADPNNARVQRLTADGVPVAQWGTRGRGPGQFLYPVAVAVDALGNIYIADPPAGVIHKLSPAGEFLAALGTGSGASVVGFATGLAVDPAGDLYVAATRLSRVVKLSPDGERLAQWSTYGIGPEQLVEPVGIAVDTNGAVYVANGRTRGLKKYGPEGELLADWPQLRARRVAVDSGGTIYIADEHQVRKLNPTGESLAQWGIASDAPGHFKDPHGVAVDSQGNVYIADTGNTRIQKLSPVGVPVAQWKDGEKGLRFDKPHSVALDSEGNIYVADPGNRTITQLGPNGDLVALLGRVPAAHAVALDRRGNLYGAGYVPPSMAGFVFRYGRERDEWRQQWQLQPEQLMPVALVVDQDEIASVLVGAGTVPFDRIQRLTSGGRVLTEWPVPGTDGAVATEGNLAVDGRGNLYLADVRHKRILKASQTGELLDQWSTAEAVHGTVAGIAVSAAGDVYVTDAVHDQGGYDPGLASRLLKLCLTCGS